MGPTGVQVQTGFCLAVAPDSEADRSRAKPNEDRREVYGSYFDPQLVGPNSWDHVCSTAYAPNRPLASHGLGRRTHARGGCPYTRDCLPFVASREPA